VVPTAVWFSVGSDYFESKRPIGRLPGGAFFLFPLDRIGDVADGRFVDCQFSCFKRSVGLANRVVGRTLGFHVLLVISKFEEWATAVLVVLGWSPLAHSIFMARPSNRRCFTGLLRNPRTFGFAALVICLFAKQARPTSVVLAESTYIS